MFEKNGKYYADWRDTSGRRLRKAFTSRRAALTHEAEQKEVAHPKRQARRTPSPTSYAPTSSGHPRSATRAPLLKGSSRLQVISARTNSEPATRSKSRTLSKPRA